jgi:molybdopterin converting factor small subunit
MKIQFFGSLGDRLGRVVEIDLPPETVTIAALRDFLAKRFPELGDALARPEVRACIGDRIVGEDEDLTTADEVDFFPPLSGG